MYWQSIAGGINVICTNLFMITKSELYRSVVEIQCLVSCRWLGVFSRLSSVQVNMRSEKFYHIAQEHTHKQSRDPEPEHCNSHRQVGYQGRSFVPQIEVLFITDVVCCHFPHQCIKCTFSTQGVVSFRLVSSQMFRVVSCYVSVVSVLRCCPLKPVQHL